MRSLYIVQIAASLRREGSLLQVWLEGKKQAEFSVHDVGQLVLMGNILVTPAAFDLVLERGIDTVLLTLSGRFRGRVVGRLSGNVKLRLEQYRKLGEPATTLRLAKVLVRGKLANQRALLARHARRHGRSARLDSAEVALRAAGLRLELAEDLDEARGCEGAGAAAYFRGFGELIRAEGFRFETRSRRPPLDPVNALLSLGYTLLINRVEAALEIVGLDPYVGALHSLQAQRPSLACDLMEEYRAPVIDALVVGAVNRRVVLPDGFEDMGPGEPVRMKREVVRTMVQLFERRMAREVAYPPQGRRLTWGQVIEQQARRFARDVLGQDEYVCFEPR